MTQRLIRAIVRPSPEVIYRAPKKVRVQITVPQWNYRGDDQTQVRISTRPDPNWDWDGFPMPFDSLVLVDLDAGEELWAITTDQAEVGISVLDV